MRWVLEVVNWLCPKTIAPEVRHRRNAIITALYARKRDFMTVKLDFVFVENKPGMLGRCWQCSE